MADTPAPKPTEAPVGDVAWKLAAACGAGGLLVSLLAAMTPLESLGKYTIAAEQLLAGQLPAERLLDFSPFYLWLNVGLMRLGLDAPRLLEALQIGLAALCVALLYALLEPRLGRRLACLGALIFALDRHLLVYQRVLEPEMILLTALLGTVILLERPGPRAALAAGVLAAIAIATRPTFLPIFLAVPLFYRWRQGVAEKDQAGSDTAPVEPTPSWRRLAICFMLPLLGGVLLLGLHAGSPLAPVMNPGTVFFEGNQPLSAGTSAIYPPLVLSMVRDDLDVADAAHEHYRTVARAAPGLAEDASPAEVNGLWSGRARAFLLDHPAAAVDRLTGKLRYALHSFRWHDVPSAARYERRLTWPAPPVGLPFSLLAALALVGLATAVRQWRSALPFYVLFGVQLAVMLTFYVSARQRLVLLPAVIFFALVALRALAESRRTSRRRLIFGVVLILTLTLALSLPDDAMRDESYQQRGFLEAGPLMAALQKGAPLSKRHDEIVQAMAAMPWWVDWMRPAFVPQSGSTLDQQLADELVRRRGSKPLFLADSADFDLAGALMRVGRDHEAREILQPLVDRHFIAYRGARAPSDPRVLLAEIDGRAGQLTAAKTLLEEALDARPSNPFALASLAAIDPAREEAAVASIDRYFGEPDRRWIFGRTLRRWGQPERAARQLAPLATRLPQLRALRVELALALGQAGDIDSAAAELLAANRLHIEPVIDIETAAAIARRWADAHPDDGQIQWRAAQLLDQHGQTAEALARLEKLTTKSDLSATLRAQVERTLTELRGR